jgi:ankyrin repeat protein
MELSSPIIYAVGLKNMDIVKYLVKLNVDVNGRDGDSGMRPLHIALAQDNADMGSILRNLISAKKFSDKFLL